MTERFEDSKARIDRWIDRIEKASVFYPVILGRGKMVPGTSMMRTMLKDGKVISTAIQMDDPVNIRVTTKVMDGFQKGRNNGCRQSPGTKETMLEIRPGLLKAWKEVMWRIYNRIVKEGGSPYDWNEDKSDPIEDAARMYETAEALLALERGRVKAQESGLDGPYVTYILYDFRNGVMRREQVREVDLGFLRMDGTLFKRTCYIGRPE